MNQNRHLASYWLCGVMHTVELDSAVWCTPRSFFRCFVFMTPRDDAHHKVWLRGGMHTAKFFKNLNISAKSKLNSKILQPVNQGPRWVRIMEKTGDQKSCDTLPLIVLRCWRQIYFSNIILTPQCHGHCRAWLLNVTKFYMTSRSQSSFFYSWHIVQQLLNNSIF